MGGKKIEKIGKVPLDSTTFQGSHMNFRQLTRSVLLCGMFACSGLQAQNLSQEITSLCSGSVTMSLAIQDACATARVNLIRHLSTDAIQQASLSAQSSLTTAHIDQLTKLRTAIAPNTTTLAAIRPGTVTTPDMDASVYLQLINATAEAAANAVKNAAEKNPQLKTCTKVLLHDSALSSIIRSHKTAQSGVKLLLEGIDQQTKLLARFQKPERPSPPAGGLEAPLSPKSAPAVIGAATLAFDLVANTSALIASFRPVISSDSVTVTANFESRAAMALVSSFRTEGFNIVNFDGILANSPTRDSESLRTKLNTLKDQTTSLFDRTLVVSSYDYSVNDTPVIGGKPTAEKVDAAKKIAAEKMTAQTSQLNNARKFIESSDKFQRSILTDTLTDDGKLLTNAPIHNFDRLELLQQSLASNDKLCTLKIDRADGIADRFSKQHAFGSPDHYARAVGTMPWQLLGPDGQMIAGGNLVADSGWKPFGPPAK